MMGSMITLQMDRERPIDGRRDRWTDGRTDGRTDKLIPPVFYRTSSPSGPLPKKEKKYKNKLLKGIKRSAVPLPSHKR